MNIKQLLIIQIISIKCNFESSSNNQYLFASNNQNYHQIIGKQQSNNFRGFK